MVVGCLVHMAQSIWNGGGMHSPYDTVHMEWWWNGWSIWYSPYGMVVEYMVHMAQSTCNSGGPYGTVHIVHMHSIWNNLGRVKYCYLQLQLDPVLANFSMC